VMHVLVLAKRVHPHESMTPAATGEEI
jgi:hypothetical protein